VPLPLPQFTWNITRQGLIDREAIYYFQFLFPLEDGEAFRITSPYHDVSYFSYQVFKLY
jgi:hypothetical protein